MTKLKNLLSDKRVSLLIILFSITGRIIQLVFLFNIRVDRSFQLMAMDNFVHGNGISLSYVMPADLSTTLFDPLVKWPPGYSLLMTPFYLLFNENYILASLFVDIAFAVILILASRKILTLLGTEKYLVNLFTLLSGFFIYDFYVITSSDAITATIFILAIYFGLLLLRSQDHVLKNSILVGVFLLACGLMKYQFLPIIFIIPAYVLVIGMINRNNAYKRSGIFMMLALAAGIGILLYYQKSISGTATYISQPERGFFPENILGFFPFFPASMIKPDTLELAAGISINAISQLYRFTHLLLVCLAIFALIYSLRKNRLKNVSLKTSFLYIAFTICIGISLLLMILSITVAKEEMFPGLFWSYVEEPRYYGLAVVLIQLSVFVFYYLRTVNRYIKSVFMFLLFLFSVEIAHGVYFGFRRIQLFGKEEYSWQYEDRFQKYTDQILKKEQARSGVKKIAVTGSSYYFNHRVSLFSHAPIMHDAQSINHASLLQATRPVLLLVMLHQKDLKSFQPFLAKHPEVAGQFQDFYFYSVYVQPN